WPYSEFISIVPNVKAPSNTEFLITMKKGQRKTDMMKFSTDHRADLLTAALKFRDQFAEQNNTTRRFNAYKYHWSESRVPVVLEVGQGSVNQREPATNKLLTSYDYNNIEGLTQISDYPGSVAVIYGGFSRLHLFALEQRDEFIKCVMEAGAAYVGVAIKQRKEPITFDQYQLNRLGKY
ncbi:dnaJ homolog subfamily C member 13-like, partial [Gigantopelta aegis]